MGERRDGNSRRPERGAPFRFSSIFEGKRTLRFSYLFLVDFWKEEGEEEFRSITKYIKKNSTAIRTRRWESFEVIRRSYSYSLCSPRIPDCFPFQFLFLSTHYIRPWDRFSSGIFLFLLPLCFFFLLRSRINFDGRFDWKTFHAHLSEYEAGEEEIQIRQAYTCYYPVKLTFMDALLSTVRTFVLLSISWWVQPKINGCSRQETSRRH